jgi:tetratricopeptide (TPR) repeat protein
MAAAEKKPSRKELLKEPDQFITFSGKMIAFGQRHRRPLTYAVVAVACLLVVFTAVRYWTARAENRAFALLDQYTAQYQAQRAATENSSEEAREAVREGFETLIADYGNRVGGKLARIRYGDICYQAGRVDEAIALYERALTDFDDAPFYRALILNSLGYAHADQQDWEKATGYLTRVVAMPEAPLRDKALFVLAGIHDAQGRRDEAAAAYRKLLDEFGDSIYAAVARERVEG